MEARPRSTGDVIAALGAATFVVATVALTRATLPGRRHVVFALVFFGLQIVAVAFPLKLAPRQKLSLYTSVIFASVLLFSPLTALLIAGLGTLTGQCLRRQPTPQTLFNSAHTALQAGAAGLVLDAINGNADALALQRLQTLLAVVCAAATMYVIDVAAVSLVIGAQEGESLVAVARRTANESKLEDAAQYSLGLLAAVVIDARSWAFPLVVLLALFVYRASERAAKVREYEQALRAASERTAEARRSFLLTASHELKTPITSVKAAAQLLTRRLSQPPGAVEPDKMLTLSSIISTEAERLEMLVADLLNAARVEQGRLEMRVEPVDLVALARRVLDRFEAGAERAGQHTLVLDAARPVTGAWDATQLDHVLSNLVSNALKYSPAGGEVRVRIEPCAERVRVYVSDSGLGIAARDQPRLFQPFVRGSNAGPGIAGTGLGLFITAAIVQRHGGSITLDSTEGVGTTVVVELPWTAAEATPAR